MAHPLLQFCTSEIQEQIVLEHIFGGKTITQMAKDRGSSERSLRQSKARLMKNAAAQGYSPDHDWNHTVPDGYKVKGVSTYYNQDGQPTGQWVKSQTDQERQIQILIERLEEACSGLPKFKPTKAPVASDDTLLSLITITDFHIGALAVESETGDSWDLDIARDVFLNAINDMIKAAPKSGTGVLCQLGDFLHFDGINLEPKTAASMHILDASGRYAQLVDVAMSVMAEAVRMMLKKFGKVVVLNVEGNHDISGSIWLRKYIKHLFADEPRIEVIDDDAPYSAYLHGKVMLGFHHGHKVKLSGLAKVFSSEPRFRELWGRSDHCYIHSGHLHHERVIEDSGATAELHPTLAGRDSYAARLGLVSQRGAKLITYHETLGEVSRHTIRPRL